MKQICFVIFLSMMIFNEFGSFAQDPVYPNDTIICNDLTITVITAGAPLKWQWSRDSVNFENIEDSYQFSNSDSLNLNIHFLSPDDNPYFFRCKIGFPAIDYSEVATVTSLSSPPLPANIVSSHEVYCEISAPDSIILSCDQSPSIYDTLYWIIDSCQGQLLGYGAEIVIEAPLETTSYYAKFVNYCGGSQCESISIYVRPTIDPYFFFDQLIYCKSDSVIEPHLNVTGGEFYATSISGGNLHFDPQTGAINLILSDADLYTITHITRYPDPPYCESEFSQDLMIQDYIDPTFQYESGMFCQSEEDPGPQPLFEYPDGHYYSLDANLIVDSLSGIIDLNSSFPGKYFVYRFVLGQGACPGAVDSTEITIIKSIDQAPLISIDNPGHMTYCINQPPDTIILYVPEPDHLTFSSIQWYKDDVPLITGISDTLILAELHIPSHTSVFSVCYQNKCDTLFSDNFVITVKQKPTEITSIFTHNLLIDSVVCLNFYNNGTHFTLAADELSGGEGSILKWMINSTVIGIGNPITLNPSVYSFQSDSAYIVEAIWVNECDSTEYKDMRLYTASVMIYPQPQDRINMCYRDSDTLVVQASCTSTIHEIQELKYKWYFNDIPAPLTNDFNTYLIENADIDHIGIYYCEIICQACGSFYSSNIDVMVHKPEASIRVKGYYPGPDSIPILLICETPGYLYQWYGPDGQIIPGATSQYYYPHHISDTLSFSEGTYYVEVTDFRTGCRNSSNAIFIPLKKNVSNLTIFPNPAQDHLSIILPDNDPIGEIIITDLTGRMIYKNTDVNSIISINITYFPAGAYLVVFKSVNGKSEILKLYVQ